MPFEIKKIKCECTISKMFNSSETITFKMLKVSNDQDYVFFFFKLSNEILV